MYRDTDAVMHAVSIRENIAVESIIPVGISIGAGPAAYAVKRYRSRSILLISPYTSLPDVAADLPVFGILSSFLWYQFPVQDFLTTAAKEFRPCIGIVHGESDITIYPEHSRRLYASLSPLTKVETAFLPRIHHNNVLRDAGPEMTDVLLRCVTASSDTGEAP